METILAWTVEAEGMFGFVINDELIGERSVYGPSITAGPSAVEFTGISEIASITFTTEALSRSTAGFRATISVTQDLVHQSFLCIDCPAGSDLLTLDQLEFKIISCKL